VTTTRAPVTSESNSAEPPNWDSPRRTNTFPPTPAKQTRTVNVEDWERSEQARETLAPILYHSVPTERHHY
jgi:hypothetical protein